MVAKPASHSKSNFTDMQSVSLIENVLATHGRVMPNLSTIDKWPNIDGRVEVQDEQSNLIGPLSVQAKTLSVNHNLKFSCPVSFLSYCEIEPCLLLGVDNQTGRIYWKYFDSTVIKDIDFKNNKRTKTLYFDGSQYLDKHQTDYINSWTRIVEDNKRRLKEYDEIKDAYEKLRENANEIVGAEDDKFTKIHLFLDELNKNYDLDFPTVKKFFYPNTWKLGLAYEKYELSTVEYTLFPIPWNKNDVQIKKIDPKLAKQVREGGLGFTGHFKENPIDTRPQEYAKEVAGSKAQKLIGRKLLSHAGNEVLAREFVIAFIDKFHEQMGLVLPQDEYSLNSVLFGFYDYLPLWMEEAYTLMLKEKRNNIDEQIRRKGYFDPDVLWQLRPEERKLIQHNVSERLGKGSATINMANSDLDVGVFLELLRYLKDTETPIKRVYRKPDYSRFDGKASFVWSQYSAKDAEYNFKVVFNNLETAYNSVVERNFPGIKQELSLLDGANELAVYYKFKDEYKSFSDGPEYRLFYLKHMDRIPKKVIKIISEKRAKELESIIYNSEKRNKGEARLLQASHSRLDFLYTKTPLMDLIYKMLEARLKQYLGN